MSTKIVCPSAQQLESLMQGKVIEPQLSEFAQHLESCSVCQDKARTLSPHDTLLESLRSTSPEADQIARDVPWPLVEKLKTLAEQPRQDSSDTVGFAPDESSAQPDPDLGFLTPAQQPDELGRLGHYRILKLLGKGGMGLVFLADDPKLDRQVALKVMLPKFAAHVQAKQRFLREARAAAKLKSDHIVTIYQVDEDRGIPFLAMELLEGQPLDIYLQSGRQLKLAQVLRIGKEIAKGLAVAHEKGLIHRDIKPGNLWLDKAAGGRVKILDFGLARAQQDDIHLTQSGTIVGTPAYMAPEQAHGDKGVDARADLFSLGCVLYRLCAGDMPFHGETTMGVLLAVATTNPTPPIQINDRIPPALSELIMQLLHKDPAQRPASARDVIARLQEIEKTLADLRTEVKSGIQATTPNDATIVESSPALPPELPAPRRNWLIGLALALLLLGGGALAVYQLFFDTPHGRMVVQIEDDDIEARFKKGKIELYDKDGKLMYTLEPSERGKDLPPGNYGIKVAGADGLTVDTDKFEMKRGDKVIVRVLLDRAALAKKEPPNTGTKPEPGQPTGYALQFDGFRSHVEVMSLKLAPSQGPLTMEAWVQQEGPTKAHQVVAATVGNNDEMQLMLHKEGMWTFDVIRPRQMLISNRPPQLGKSWIHLAAVWDGQQPRLYLNGKYVGKGEKAGWQSSNAGIPARLFLGVCLFEKKPANYFAGLIDEVRISKGARYDKDFTPLRRFEADKDTVALFHCDEGQGDILKDTSGSGGHHGKIFGAKWVKVDGTALDPDRRAAEWVLSKGGSVRINGRMTQPINKAAELPAEAFKLSGVLLTGDALNDEPGLAAFQGCKHLTLLSLGYKNISNEALAHFKDCATLQSLALTHSNVSDAALANFKNCQSLVMLELNDTQVTDAGLAQFKECRKLELLTLRNTQVSDASAAYLASLQGLLNLRLKGTRVTPATIEVLRKALPKCRIDHDGGVIEPKKNTNNP